MKPMKISPVFKKMIWGSESWGLSCHEAGRCEVESGTHKGRSLWEVVCEHPEDILGRRGIEAGGRENFPLLFKVIDAKDKLSVQVHPDDDYAAKHENGERGKTEMWYVLAAAEGSQLVYGVKPGVTKESFLEGIESGKLDEKLNYLPVFEGDVFFIPAGMIHAIGGGILIAEIQQSSNTTYRVYDYNRVDKEGKGRELHLQKAADVSDFTPVKDGGKLIGSAECDSEGNRLTRYVRCPYFSFDKIEVSKRYSSTTNGDSFVILFCASGGGNILCEGEELPFSKGDTVLLPSNAGVWEITGKCTLLKAYIE